MTGACDKPSISATADLPDLSGLEVDPSRAVVSPEPRPDRVAVSHVLIAYTGAQGAGVHNRMSRLQARKRADHLLTVARARNQDFTALSRRFSDDSASGANGDLGVVMPGQLHPALEKAVFQLDLGQVSDVVESPRGFHILMRNASTEAQAAEIVIAYDGVKKHKPRNSRNREQAATLAAELRSRAVKGEDFDELAFRYSDLSNWRQAGYFPIFRKGKRHPEFEKILWPLSENEVSDVIETPTGFHIVKRFPLRRIAGRLIEIGFRPDVVDADRSGDGRRTEREAFRLMRELRRQVVRSDGDFAALAARRSDHASGEHGGWLGWIGRGELARTLDRAAFSLEVGQVSEILTDAQSLFLIKRTK